MCYMITFYHNIFKSLKQCFIIILLFDAVSQIFVTTLGPVVVSESKHVRINIALVIY